MAPARSAAPARIRSARLLLRPLEVADAGPLAEAIESSLEYLRAWMPWALAEPETRSAKAERIARNRVAFEAGERFVYGIFAPEGGECWGVVALEPVSEGEGWRADPRRALEIGYWIRASRSGRGLVTEATGVLTRVAFERLDLEYLEIQCDPDNAASAAIPRKLGYTHAATRRANKRTPQGGLRDTMLWSMDAAGYPGSAAAGFDFAVGGEGAGEEAP